MIQTQKHVDYGRYNWVLTGLITGRNQTNHICGNVKAWAGLEKNKNGYENYSDVSRPRLYGVGTKKAFEYNTSELYQEMIDLKEDWILAGCRMSLKQSPRITHQGFFEENSVIFMGSAGK